MKKAFLSCYIFLLLLICATACQKKSPLPACLETESPVVSGCISGHVQNIYGKPIAGAAVTLRNTDTNSAKGAATDLSGDFCILGILPGTK